jgi:probable HAF family extracellular repeat protein
MNNKFDELAKGLAQSVTRRQALKKFGLSRAGIALACFGLAGGAEAGPTFTSIEYPGAGFTAATDINNSGHIIGWYIDGTGYHGFLLANGTFTPITYPGAGFTAAIAINRNGDIVGEYSTTTGEAKDVHGFLLRGGAFTSIDYPGATLTRATGINSNGDIVGIATDGGGKDHGFLLSGGVFSCTDFPGSAATDTWKINDGGEITGRYLSSGDDKYHIYRLIGGTFTSVPDFPGSVQTASGAVSAHFGGLNGVGDIVSDYANASPVRNNSNDNVIGNGNLHGLLLNGGVYSTIDFPGAASTVSYGINDNGYIVGSYQDTNEAFHGYLRTP